MYAVEQSIYNFKDIHYKNLFNLIKYYYFHYDSISPWPPFSTNHTEYKCYDFLANYSACTTFIIESAPPCNKYIGANTSTI